jgi:inward rectifier potassium channel
MPTNRSGLHLKFGELEAIKLGAHRFSWRDPYHLVLSVSWPIFFSLAVSFYLLTNLSFAMAYWAVPGTVANARPGSFADVFFFSIETLATVGYGVMSPATLYGHLVSSTEIIFGMMSTAVITGLVFVRFSRPRARLLFSRVAVVGGHLDRPALMVRVVNERHQAMSDVYGRLTLLRSTRTVEGHVMRRFIDLPLEMSNPPLIGLAWTMIHAIDELSPLHGATAASLEEEGCILLATVSGYDEAISAAVTSRQSYVAKSMRFDHRFVDILDQLPTGEAVLDLTHFHDTVPTAPDSKQA